MVSVFDELWREYDSWYDRNRDIFLKEIDLIKRNIGDFIPGKSRGLEVGAGSGRFAEKFRLIGIDISEKMLKLARSRGVEVIRGDALNLPFKSGTFDLVLLAFTICFLDDPARALKEVRRVLVRRGLVLLCFVPEGELAEEYRKKDSPFYREAKFYSVEEIENMLISSGFTVDGVDYEDLKYGKDVALVRALK